MNNKSAIIIGAGPAGLTAAIELQRLSGIKPILIELSQEIGGISRTVRYKGNRMDIGGHRFFSKSDRVMQWWLDLMPVEAGSNPDGELRYQGQQRDLPEAAAAFDPQSEDLVMLVRQRKSRIYFLRRFFDYPISLTAAIISLSTSTEPKSAISASTLLGGIRSTSETNGAALTRVRSGPGRAEPWAAASRRRAARRRSWRPGSR